MQGDELMLHMSESIKERRKLAGYKSVKSLCDQLTDVNSKAYYEYESGRTAIPIHIAVEVADVRLYARRAYWKARKRNAGGPSDRREDRAA